MYKHYHPSRKIDEKVLEARHTIYSSDIVEDAALVLDFEWQCPTIGGVQPVFLVQKKLSQAVREQEGVESPYVN